ncbi:hypothetical protein GGR54DRAFT_636366 [Hypoxylon sp. NC1633]|nr:hypothetical protein GGR54DRAFT_636366 [Hypoxylon sp. NC1633]
MSISHPPTDLAPAHRIHNGTFSSMNANNTANTTETAAVAIWHMLQEFFSVFPDLNPPEDYIFGVNLFSESYGGKYGPAYAQKWEEMNAARSNVSMSNTTTIATVVKIRLDSLGTSTTYSKHRRAAAASQDPDSNGSVPNVNRICASSYTSCLNNVKLPYSDAGRSLCDMCARQIGSTATATPSATTVVETATVATQLTGLFTVTATPSSAADARQRPSRVDALHLGAAAIAMLVLL